VLIADNVQSGFARTGERLRGYQRHDADPERGAGVYIGVEMVRDRGSRAVDAVIAGAIVNGLRERGVLISATGASANILKIRPPLVLARTMEAAF
jgi:4-aminobutyrate aminotransferase-like enzyme